MCGMGEMVVNAARFCISRKSFGWPDSAKRGVISNCLRVLIGGGCE